MAPHSSTLAWKIPWMEEPGRLKSIGSLRVGHDWATSLSLFTLMHWRRKWQPTPVFLPGESQGRGSLVGCHLWGCTESDTTEVTQQQQQQQQQQMLTKHCILSLIQQIFIEHLLCACHYIEIRNIIKSQEKPVSIFMMLFSYWEKRNSLTNLTNESH